MLLILVWLPRPVPGGGMDLMDPWVPWRSHPPVRSVGALRPPPQDRDSTSLIGRLQALPPAPPAPRGRAHPCAWRKCPRGGSLQSQASASSLPSSRPAEVFPVYDRKSLVLGKGVFIR